MLILLGSLEYANKPCKNSGVVSGSHYKKGYAKNSPPTHLQQVMDFQPSRMPPVEYKLGQLFAELTRSFAIINPENPMCIYTQRSCAAQQKDQQIRPDLAEIRKWMC